MKAKGNIYSKDEIKELEDYLKNTDDEIGKSIWLIAENTTLLPVDR